MKSNSFPVISTVVVGLAIAIMLALGFWQLDRLGEKERQLVQLAANFDAPPVAYPILGPVDETLLFRQSSVTCLSVSDWKVEAGKAANGVTGFRYIAQCATGAEGPGAQIVIGVGDKPDLKPSWNGGAVSGWITFAAEDSGLLARLMGHNSPNTAVLVAKKGLSGLKDPAIPNVNSVPNNHLAYAIQWFLFAAIATGIYAILLWRRFKGHNPA